MILIIAITKKKSDFFLFCKTHTHIFILYEKDDVAKLALYGIEIREKFHSGVYYDSCYCYEKKYE